MAQVNEMKRVPVISCETREDGLVFTCVTGQRMEVFVKDLSDGIKHAAMLHGLKQKLIDAAAISRNPDTGRSASPEDKWQAVYDMAARVTGETGQWNAARGDGAGAGGNGLLFRALVRMYPAKTQEQLRVYLDGKTKAEQAALRANPKVAAVIDELKSAAVKAGDVDTDELLAELGEV